jgi:hypothetical protein
MVDHYLALKRHQPPPSGSYWITGDERCVEKVPTNEVTADLYRTLAEIQEGLVSLRGLDEIQFKLRERSRTAISPVLTRWETIDRKLHQTGNANELSGENPEPASVQP